VELSLLVDVVCSIGFLVHHCSPELGQIGQIVPASTSITLEVKWFNTQTTRCCPTNEDFTFGFAGGVSPAVDGSAVVPGRNHWRSFVTLHTI